MAVTLGNKSNIWIIAGPTASGKSSLALKMAEYFNGEILNADSIQAYRDLRVLTARPSIEDEQRVPHHGYGILDPVENLSAGAWRRWVHAQICRLQTKVKAVIIVGGTGLYIKSLTQPFVDLPDIDPTIRTGIITAITHDGLEKHYNELQAVDPLTAQKISPHDAQRTIRALEVFKATGVPLSIWQTERCLPPQYDFKIVLIQPPRAALNDRAENRVDEMLLSGAIEEITQLIHQAVPLTAPIFRALGAKELWQYLKHQLTMVEASQLIKQTTRQYIKRQYTWFRHQLIADIILSNDLEVQEFLSQLQSD